MRHESALSVQVYSTQARRRCSHTKTQTAIAITIRPNNPPRIVLLLSCQKNPGRHGSDETNFLTTVIFIVDGYCFE